MPPLHHEVAGRGPGVLLIHAGVCDSRMWDPQWRELQTSFALIRCDLRGFGRSPVPESPWVNADDLAEVLDLAGASSAAVVGASYGGLVALEFAARHPQRVERLVLLAPAWDLEPDPAFVEFAEEEERLLVAGDVDGAVEANVRAWVQPDVDDATRTLVREMQRRAFDLQLERPDVEPEEVEVDLHAITAPATVFTGARDFELFRRVGVHLAAELPDARHVELDWAGHLPSLERPAEATRLIDGELRR